MATKSKINQFRPKTKSHKLVEMLRRPSGASPAEIEKSMGWTNNTVRGALSRLRGTIKIRLVADDRRGTVYHA